MYTSTAVLVKDYMQKAENDSVKEHREPTAKAPKVSEKPQEPIPTPLSKPGWFETASWSSEVAYDSTVVLDKAVANSDLHKGADAGRSRQLSGRLFADCVEFTWQARSLYGKWFVSVANAKCGSRSELTRGDPINFALQLAKQMVRPEAMRE